MLSTFEMLPDEILMVIIHDSGNIYSIFRAFSGLNQRINNILIDKCMHLLIDFLLIDIRDVNIDKYYQSEVFHNVSQQLLSRKTIENDQQFRECLQSLVTFHIRYKYQQSADQLELGLAKFQTIRMNVTNCEIDRKLEKIFKNLQNNSKLMKNIKQIESLIFIEGAKLECPDSEYLEFNFAQAANHLLVKNVTSVQFVSQRFINSIVEMLKSIIISNLKLLHNRAYAVNGGCPIFYFLFHAIYRCKEFNCQRSVPSLNIRCYHGIVDLLLFILKCQKFESVNESWWVYNFLEFFDFICPIQLDIDQEIFVYTSQIEILKIILDENMLREIIPCTLSRSFGNLFKCYRLDMILFILQYDEYVRNIFQPCWTDLKFIGILTGSSMGRRLFHSVLNNKAIGIWLSTNPDLLFILLKKKECKLVKKFFSLSPSLIHQLDEDGNDPLLYICLKVRGCRHRLIEYLIKIECDLERRNFRDENFYDALKLKRNRNLLEKLIHIDQNSGEIKIKRINSE